MSPRLIPHLYHLLDTASVGFLSALAKMSNLRSLYVSDSEYLQKVSPRPLRHASRLDNPPGAVHAAIWATFG